MCKVVLGERECCGESTCRGCSSQEGLDHEAEDQIKFQIIFIFVRIVVLVQSVGSLKWLFAEGFSKSVI